MAIESWYELSLHVELGGFREYLTAMGEALAERRRRFEAMVDAQTAKLSGEATDELYQRHRDTLHGLTVVFPARLYNSFLLTLCAWSEAELTNLCRFTERRVPEGVRLADVAGKGLRRCQTFLKRVSHIDFPDTSAEWARLLLLYDIRNTIAHTEGETTALRPEVMALLSVRGCLTEDVSERVQLNAPFCDDAVDATERFFLKLGATLPEDMQVW